jgi:methyl-accepting chemotaxis protein
MRSEAFMSDNVQDITTAILIDIRDELRGGFARLDARLDQTNSRLDQTNSRLDQTNSRLDNLIETVGGVTRGHSDRIGALERRVGKLERGGPRRRPQPPRGRR